METRPINLIFVRHGESEANVVHIAEKRGDPSGYTPEFRARHNSEMRLTERGVQQALAAGAWIRANINGGYFQGYYVSSYRRAKQTAGHLHLPEGETKAIWKERDYLRERGYGYLDGMPAGERQKKYPEIMAARDRDHMYWPGFGGETMSDLIFRARGGIIDALHRDLPGGDGITVTHATFMWAIRYVVEGLTVKTYQELHNDPGEEILNCQILHYTRVNPSNPDHKSENFGWMRSICPWDLSLSRNEWREIVRPKFTNQDLLK